MDLADEEVPVVDLPADEQRLAVLRVTGDESIFRNVAVTTGSPVAGGSTNENLKVSLRMCVVAPSDEKQVLRWNHAAYKTF